MNLRSAGRMGLTDRPSKHEAFLALLREGWTSLHLDARRAGVVVPVHLRGQGHLVLQYGNDLPIAIPDLHVDEYGVTATLSFARSPQHTVVPWTAVYVVASDDGRGVLYHEDVPPDVSVIAGGEGEPAAEGDREPEIPTLRETGPVDTIPLEIAARATPTRALRAVPMGGPGPVEEMGDDFGDEQGSQAMPARRRRRPQLRLVK